MECQYRVPKTGDRRDPIYDRIVEMMEEGAGCVSIKVNGMVVARFRRGCDHLEIYSPHTEMTGLSAGPRGLLKVE